MSLTKEELEKIEREDFGFNITIEDDEDNLDAKEGLKTKDKKNDGDDIDDTDNTNYTNDKNGGRTKNEDSKTEETEEEIKAKKIANFYYNELVDSNILKPNLNIKNLDELNKAIEDAKLEYISNYFNSLPDDLRKDIESYTKGIDYTKFRDNTNKIKEYSKINEESLKSDKELAKKLIAEVLKKDGDDDSYIKERLAVIEDSDTYFLEGKRALKILVAAEIKDREAKLKEEENKVKENEKEVAKFKESIEETLSDSSKLWGSRISESIKDKVRLAMLNVPEFKRKYSNMKTFDEVTRDPIALTQIYYLYAIGAFGANGNLESIKADFKSNVINEIDDLIKGNVGTGFRNATKGSKENGLSFMDELASNLKARQ